MIAAHLHALPIVIANIATGSASIFHCLHWQGRNRQPPPQYQDFYMEAPAPRKRKKGGTSNSDTVMVSNSAVEDGPVADIEESMSGSESPMASPPQRSARKKNWVEDEITLDEEEEIWDDDTNCAADLENMPLKYCQMRMQERKTNFIPAMLDELRIGELDIPLCWMISMEEVRVAMPSDIEEKQCPQTFRKKYIPGSAKFYVSLERSDGITVDVTSDISLKWTESWKLVNDQFEADIQKDPSLHHLSNKMFHVWDGNHRLLAWMPYIKDYHS